MPDTTAVTLPELPPECMDFVMHVWDYLDDRLPAEQARVLRDHVAHCSNCQGYQQFQRSFLEAMARQRDRTTAPAVLKARVARLVRGPEIGER